ncbi:DUF481 domain-containing protein [Rickettsiales bacterium]|nr:DUF481 domain-containing protein [Rickettsiales bacterium]
MHKFFTTKLFCFAVFAVLCLFSNAVFAKTSFVDLKKNSFYKNPKSKQYIFLGGGYDSDYNSYEYDINAAYKYKSHKFIHEIDFLHEVTHSSTTKTPMKKKEELYDLEISNRMILLNSKNYLNIYNRLQYDEFSDFYYDYAAASGLGRLFFNGNLEASLNLGHQDIKETGSQKVLLAMINAKFKLNDIVKIAFKGDLIGQEEDYDEKLKSILSLRLRKRLSLQLVHKYERNRYIKTTKTYGRQDINRVKRSIYLRFKYDF